MKGNGLAKLVMILHLCVKNEVRQQKEKKEKKKERERKRKEKRYHHPWIQRCSLLVVVVFRWWVHIENLCFPFSQPDVPTP